MDTIVPQRASLVVFFRQRAVRELPDRRVRVLRGLAASVAASGVLVLARWALSGVAP